MGISPKTLKVLWSLAAGRCSFPGCGMKLCLPNDGGGQYVIGEMAHICGERLGACRHDPNQTPSQRDGYENLILLCPNHHTMIDECENDKKYSVDVLLKWKRAHEADVEMRWEQNILDSKYEIAKKIAFMLSENREVWRFYGPTSDLARKNPNDDVAYAIWRSERLSTIVPNNRALVSILEKHREKFDVRDRHAIAEFLVHARSYERWVSDEISYNAVVRFPCEFSEMIERIIDASIQ